MMKMCAFDGCPNHASPKAAKGLCNSHYWQMHKGRELTPLSYRRNVTEPWLLAHVGHEGDDCLTWPFQRLKNDGRAVVKWNGKQSIAARVMCELAHGAPPTPKHEAAHSCGNGDLGCIHPKHLRWATKLENEADKAVHGTNSKPRLTHGQIDAIREFAHNVSLEAVASLFDITQQHAANIVSRKVWAFL